MAQIYTNGGEYGNAIDKLESPSHLGCVILSARHLLIPTPNQPDISLAGRRIRPYEEDGAVELSGN